MSLEAEEQDNVDLQKLFRKMVVEDDAFEIEKKILKLLEEKKLIDEELAWLRRVQKEYE